MQELIICKNLCVYQPFDLILHLPGPACLLVLHFQSSHIFQFGARARFDVGHFNVRLFAYF